ncbi:MAG: D-alanyl-D-alanine carboxypeptidase [Rhodobacter sp.]|nr:D-alanyl-D-alanine carboxypeptidase [Paracoccaceae bacterium]MCC0077021.1 D-alanyl-D-alanine carboxypeptidase [Rhodobacter sp.]
MMMACALTLLTLSSSAARAQPYAALIMDVRTGEILYQTDNANSRLHPASLTKMMTLYIAFEALENGEISLDTRVRISRHAAAQPPSRLGLRAGQTISFRYLIRAAALRSANDAAVAIAEAIEGSVPRFADRMNRTARAIGMQRTHFANPHGLTTDGHLSTARDMARLGRQLYFDYPQYYNIFSRRSEDAGIATVRNTNRRFLDSYRGADGIKTGFTNAAGYNLVAMAERGGVRILVVAMGSHSSAQRLQRVTNLMDRGFRLAPRRAAVRRPARPDYVHAPEDRGSGPAAGRVIRLQTAPTASLFPRARPAPGSAPSADMIASIQDGIDEVMDEIREPDPSTDTDDPGVAAGVTSEEPDDPGGEEDGGAAAEVALDSSLMPRARPEDVAVADASDDAAEAAGFTVIDAERYAAITGAPPELPQPRPADLGTADPETAAGGTADTATDEAATDDTAETAAAGPVSDTEIAEGVSVDAEGVTIAGLPPIALESDESTAAPELAAAPDPALLAPVDSLEPASTELTVDDSGRILWRDEEVLQAMAHEDPADPVMAPTIVLTTSDSDSDEPAQVPMPEIVTRVSTSGGRLWAVDLGTYGSRFDAERMLLRLALTESGTLGTGVRRVTTRAGRFHAEVQSLSEMDASLACQRLLARDLPCTVLEP